MFQGLIAWYRRQRERRLTIADFQWQEAESPLPFLACLTIEDKQRLRQMASQFIADKQWHAAQGLPLTAEIQLTIALQACLPVLNLGLDWYAGWVGIVVYPGDFVIPRQWMDDTGVVHEFDDEVLGEAWEGGPVLLSWFEPQDTPRTETLDGSLAINIVIHEFAHKLDMAHGPADGMPRLHAGMSRQAWVQAMGAAFEDMNQSLDRGEQSRLDPYAAEAPAEFFAVASESFFVEPQALLTEYPAVYQQLAQFYRQDPAARPGPALNLDRPGP